MNSSASLYDSGFTVEVACVSTLGKMTGIPFTDQFNTHQRGTTSTINVDDPTVSFDLKLG